jgi:hypothetical protein
MADVLSSPLGNFGLELYFLTPKLSQKAGEHMLTVKIDRGVILSARSVRPLSQIGQISPLENLYDQFNCSIA